MLQWTHFGKFSLTYFLRIQGFFYLTFLFKIESDHVWAFFCDISYKLAKYVLAWANFESLLITLLLFLVKVKCRILVLEEWRLWNLLSQEKDYQNRNDAQMKCKWHYIFS